MIVEYTTVRYSPVLGVSTKYSRRVYRFRWWGRFCMGLVNITPGCFTGIGWVFKSGKEVNNGAEK